MRSDRNPYFLLKKSKDPRVQQHLLMAENMSHQQIDQLPIKPDLKKAMHFVRQFGRMDRSVSTADLIVERATVAAQALPSYPIYHYQGPTVELFLNKKNSLIIDDFLFLRDADRIFVSHNWIDLELANNRCVLDRSVPIGIGDQQVYNQMTQQHLQRKHHQLR
jgi:hypothetical protein